MKKIIITGGAGFIGSKLAIALVNLGHNVLVMDNLSHGNLDNFPNKDFINRYFIKIDVKNPEIDKYFDNVDVLFNFAAISSLPLCQSNVNYAFENNVNSLVNLLEISRKRKVKKIIFASTSAVYENCNSLPFKEDFNVMPDLIYSLTKYTGENICKSYATNYKLDIINLRFFNVFGENQDIHRMMPPFISYLSKQVFYNSQPVLFNNTDTKRDYIYIDDLVKYLILIMGSKENYSGDIFNICSEKGYSVPEIVKIFESITGRRIKPIYKNPEDFWKPFSKLYEGLKLDPQRIVKEVYKTSIGSNKKIINEFSYKPIFSLDSGLEKLWKFTLNNLKS